jgi:hypothetical protein
MPSTGQVISVLVVFLGFAWFLHAMRRHFIRRFDVPPSRYRWIPISIALFGILFTVVSTIVARAVYDQSHHSFRLAGTLGMREGDPAVLRTVRFEVPDAGSTLSVNVRAIPGKGVPVKGPVRVRLALLDPADQALVDTVLSVPVRRHRGWRGGQDEWAGELSGCLASAAGRYTFRLVPLNPGIERFMVRIVETGPR